MSLSKPGLGDIIDRISVVARKFIEVPNRTDFSREVSDLVSMRDFAEELKTDDYVMNLFYLAALNAAIWQREDKLREVAGKLGTGTYSEIGLIAVEIQRLNDKRAALIAELNGTPSEKLYK